MPGAALSDIYSLTPVGVCHLSHVVFLPLNDLQVRSCAKRRESCCKLKIIKNCAPSQQLQAAGIV